MSVSEARRSRVAHATGTRVEGRRPRSGSARADEEAPRAKPRPRRSRRDEAGRREAAPMSPRHAGARPPEADGHRPGRRRTSDGPTATARHAARPAARQAAAIERPSLPARLAFAIPPTAGARSTTSRASSSHGGRARRPTCARSGRDSSCAPRTCPTRSSRSRSWRRSRPGSRATTSSSRARCSRSTRQGIPDERLLRRRLAGQPSGIAEGRVRRVGPRLSRRPVARAQAVRRASPAPVGDPPRRTPPRAEPRARRRGSDARPRGRRHGPARDLGAAPRRVVALGPRGRCLAAAAGRARRRRPRRGRCSCCWSACRCPEGLSRRASGADVRSGPRTPAAPSADDPLGEVPVERAAEDRAGSRPAR